MKITVVIKTSTGGAIDPQDAFLRVGRTLPSVLPAFDAHAVEEAVRIRERTGNAEIVVLAVGLAEGLGGLREALGMGADRAVMLSDPLLDGSDLLAMSRALAALMRTEPSDLYLACPWTGDVDGALLWAMTAERLGLPVFGQTRRLTLEDGRVSGERQAEGGEYLLAARLPCFVELSESINTPRFVAMKGRQMARSKPVRLVTLADVGLDPTHVGASGSGTTVLSVAPAPATRTPQIHKDLETAAEKIVTFLEERRLLP